MKKLFALGLVSVLCTLGPAQAQAGFFSKLKKAASRVITAVENTVARGTSELFCDRDSAYGIQIECFNRNGTNNVKSVLNILAADHSNQVHGEAPLSYVQNRVARIMNYESRTVQTQFFYVPGGSWIGYFPALPSTKGPILLKNSFFNESAAFQASVLVHEADHSRFGMHTCGAEADRSDDGAYATDIRYLKQLERNGHPYLSRASQASLKSLAYNRVYRRICDNRAQSRLANEVLN